MIREIEKPLVNADFVYERAAHTRCIKSIIRDITVSQ